MKVIQDVHYRNAWLHLHRHKNDKSMRYLAKLNRSLGRKRADKLIEEVAQAVEITGGEVYRYPRAHTNHNGTVRSVASPASQWRVIK